MGIGALSLAAALKFYLAGEAVAQSALIYGLMACGIGVAQVLAGYGRAWLLWPLVSLTPLVVAFYAVVSFMGRGGARTLRDDLFVAFVVPAFAWAAGFIFHRWRRHTEMMEEATGTGLP
ncbi:MAG: hypothetical protein ACPGUV_07360 [Polyangiales bacterium]